MRRSGIEGGAGWRREGWSARVGRKEEREAERGGCQLECKTDASRTHPAKSLVRRSRCKRGRTSVETAAAERVGKEGRSVSRVREEGKETGKQDERAPTRGSNGAALQESRAEEHCPRRGRGERRRRGVVSKSSSNKRRKGGTRTGWRKNEPEAGADLTTGASQGDSKDGRKKNRERGQPPPSILLEGNATRTGHLGTYRRAKWMQSSWPGKMRTRMQQ